MSTPYDKCIKRLTQEQKMLRQSPPEFIQAAPDASNMLVWYYVLNGPKETPYEGGKFLGKVKFPPDYPFAPPSIMMSTPNGRFRTDTRLCLSISDFHPKEWNPVWNSGTILTGLLSFMVGTDQTHGSIETSNAFKREMARKSHRFNIQQPYYEQLFPEDFAVSKALVDAEDAELAQADARKPGGSPDKASRDPWEERAAKIVQCVMVGCIVLVFAYAIIGSPR